jgi:hypothetical protein
VLVLGVLDLLGVDRVLLPQCGVDLRLLGLGVGDQHGGQIRQHRGPVGLHVPQLAQRLLEPPVVGQDDFDHVAAGVLQDLRHFWCPPR